MDTLKSKYMIGALILGSMTAFAQTPDNGYLSTPEEPVMDKVIDYELTENANDSIYEQMVFESLADSLLYTVQDVDQLINMQKLPLSFFLPAVYNTYDLSLVNTPFKSDYSGEEAFRWLEDANALAKRQKMIMQSVAIEYPSSILYNVTMLPEAPTRYDVVINPEDYTINMVEHIVPPAETTLVADEINKKHWLHKFDGNVQFSQAYVSPNWYQGGNNNLNMLVNLNYNIKLNQKFHPNYIFETNVSYKLGMYSTPDDSLRTHNLSLDQFQINTTAGIKAFKKWYYSFNAQFKTQLFDSWASNTRTLKSALLSPGELNAGLGMTYNTSNEKKTRTLDVSISPLSYNLIICMDNRMNVQSFGIDPGKHHKNQYGSSLEAKLALKLTNNISYNSRFFTFTDFSRAYADWENTLVFEINKYLTTQIYAYMRYDTNTPNSETQWHKLQLKEILSMGFTYKFSTI